MKEGVCEMALHNSSSAARMNEESTGNGYKDSYKSPVDVSPRNFYIEPGNKSLDELCEEMGEGYVITDVSGLHAGIDFITTNFSLLCEGYYVKDGKRDYSVNLVTVAGNFLELMKNVEDVGNDIEWKFGGIACPSIYFKECAISGE